MASKPILVLTLIHPFETILKKAVKTNTIEQKIYTSANGDLQEELVFVTCLPLIDMHHQLRQHLPTSASRSQQTFSLDSQSTPCQAWTFILFYKIIFGEGFLLMMLTNN